MSFSSSQGRLLIPTSPASFQHIPRDMTNSEIASKFFTITSATVANNLLGICLELINIYFIGLLNNAAMLAGFGLA
jgi:multidrug resistance protein, MATE family